MTDTFETFYWVAWHSDASPNRPDMWPSDKTIKWEGQCQSVYKTYYGLIFKRLNNQKEAFDSVLLSPVDDVVHPSLETFALGNREVGFRPKGFI